MGTLTADCPRLDEHCPHKLATSCRLTSTPKCCACYDRRAHSSTYSVYIDGVGMVQRGTRWQSYCWFCKEFWNNRLAATDPPLAISQTQIPHVPDQTEFLERWFEFYQGYRIARHADGSETRVAVIGEPLKEVSPGFLPRTLNQLRARRPRPNDARRPENRFRRRPLPFEEEPQEQEQPHQSLEDALDSLLDEISDEDTPDTDEQAPEQPSDMPRGPTGLSRPLSRTELRLQRARERVARVFGSREDVQRDDYVSPVASLYDRAQQRYNQAEGRRAAGATAAPPLENLTQDEREDIEQQVLWSVMNGTQAAVLRRHHQSGNVRSYTPAPLNRRRERSGVTAAASSLNAQQRASPAPQNPPIDEDPNPMLTPTSSNTSLSASSDLRSSIDQLNQLNTELSRLRFASDANIARLGLLRRRQPSPPGVTLDDQPDRPPPLTDEQMTKKLNCHVCYSQMADVAVLPCGHMVMCQWCADVIVPVRHSHIPTRPSKCPMCRKKVAQRYKIHMG